MVFLFWSFEVAAHGNSNDSLAVTCIALGMIIYLHFKLVLLIYF